MDMPEMNDCIKLNLKHASLTNPKARLGGISLNCRNVSVKEGAKQRNALQEKFGVPCFDPMITGSGLFVETLK